MQNIKKNVCSQIKNYNNDAFKFLTEFKYMMKNLKKSNKQEMGYLTLPLIVWKASKSSQGYKPIKIFQRF